jgi:hypothetical protein
MTRTFRSMALGSFLAASTMGFSTSAPAFFGLDTPLGGAASGALIGGIAGGGKGAAIGALSGALIGGIVQDGKKK